MTKLTNRGKYRLHREIEFNRAVEHMKTNDANVDKILEEEIKNTEFETMLLDITVVTVPDIGLSKDGAIAQQIKLYIGENFVMFSPAALSAILSTGRPFEVIVNGRRMSNKKFISQLSENLQTVYKTHYNE